MMHSFTSMRQTLRKPFHSLRHHLHQGSQRRAQSTKSKITSQASSPPNTSLSRILTTANSAVPGAANIRVLLAPLTGSLLAPFRAYSAIQARRPYATQLTSSVIIYFLGDLSSQTIQNRGLAERAAAGNDGKEVEVPQYDPLRAVRAVLIGAISSIPSYHYFLWLSRSFNIANRPYTSLAVKVGINQLSFAPMFNTYFFGMQSLLSSITDAITGKASVTLSGAATAAWVRVRDTVPTSWIKSCQFWPAVTAFSFTFVPPQHRGVFAGVVAIGWQSYLGILNQRAARAEVAEADGSSDATVMAKG